MSLNSEPAQILNTLEHKDDKNLDKFRSKLQNSAEEPRMKINKVKNKPRDRRTSRTFREVDSNSKAQELDKNTRNSQQRAVKKEEHFVARHRVKLIARVSNINQILDLLLQEKVLQQEQYDEVYGIRPTQKQIRFLYCGPLKASEKSKDVFLSALKELEPNLIQDLREKEESHTEANFANNHTSTKPSTEELEKLANTKLLFGTYKEKKTFKWLLENDCGYAAFFVGQHQREIEDQKSQIMFRQNKDSLAKYVAHFPEVMEEASLHRDGLAPLGFGKYKKETRKALYNSTDEKKKKYVNRLRGRKPTGKDSLMDAVINYILRRDNGRPPVSSTAPLQQKRKSTVPHTQSKPDVKKQKLS